MSKTLYYRETDPNTKKAKWIKLEGVKGDNDAIYINKKIHYYWGLKDPMIVYKTTKKRAGNFAKLVKDGERFEYNLSEDEKLRLMQRR